ncbi:unnamed protein product [Orchesella dallaii]|uniref:Uncharacterized protein n=1 Tax=Orchesella dallaii TaxID=48710 RepID=A0ABP1RAU2_9HEXA
MKLLLVVLVCVVVQACENRSESCLECIGNKKCEFIIQRTTNKPFCIDKVNKKSFGKVRMAADTDEQCGYAQQLVMVIRDRKENPRTAPDPKLLHTTQKPVPIIATTTRRQEVVSTPKPIIYIQSSTTVRSTTQRSSRNLIVDESRLLSVREKISTTTTRQTTQRPATNVIVNESRIYNHSRLTSISQQKSTTTMKTTTQRPSTSKSLIVEESRFYNQSRLASIPQQQKSTTTIKPTTQRPTKRFILEELRNNQTAKSKPDQKSTTTTTRPLYSSTILETKAPIAVARNQQTTTTMPTTKKPSSFNETRFHANPSHSINQTMNQTSFIIAVTQKPINYTTSENNQSKKTQVFKSTDDPTRATTQKPIEKMSMKPMNKPILTMRPISTIKPTFIQIPPCSHAQKSLFETIQLSYACSNEVS